MTKFRPYAVASKMDKTVTLLTDLQIRNFIPDTRPFSPLNLARMLSLYPEVYVKPDEGGGGARVASINQQDSRFVVHYRTNKTTYQTQEQVISFLQRLARGDLLLLQRGIAVLQIDGKPFDVRVCVQKPGHEWLVTGLIAKVAAPGKIVTNRCSGGKPLALEKALHKAGISGENKTDVRQNLAVLAGRAALVLETKYPALRELGLDVGLDRNLHPWIFEVNTQPRYKSFLHLPDPEIYRKIDEYHLKITSLQTR
jgi:hypothetical protein